MLFDFPSNLAGRTGVSYGGDKRMVESSNSRGSTQLSQTQGIVHSTLQGISRGTCMATDLISLK